MEDLEIETVLSDLSFEEKQNLALCLARIAESDDDIDEISDFFDFFFLLVSTSNLKDKMHQVFNAEIENLQKEQSLDFAEIDKQSAELFEQLFVSPEDSLQLLRILTLTQYSHFSELILEIFFENEYSKTSKKKNEKLFSRLESLTKADELAKILNLNKTEKSILNIVCLFYSCKESLFLLEAFSEYTSLRNIYGCCGELPFRDLRTALSRRGQLRVANILNANYFLTESAYKCIISGNYDNLFSNILKPGSDYAFDVSDFDVNKEQTSLLLRLLNYNSPTNIFLYGKDAFTKLEFARSVIKKTNNVSSIFALNQESEDDDDDDDCFSSEEVYSKLKNVFNTKNNAILIVTNADSIFALRRRRFLGLGQEGLDFKNKRVQSLLKLVQRPTLWIFEDIELLEKTLLENFTFSMEVGGLTTAIKKSLIQTEVDRFNDYFTINNLPNLKSKIMSTFEQYDFSISKMQNLLSTITSIPVSDQTEDEIINDFDLIVKTNVSLKTEKSKMRNTVKSTYDLSVLNTSIEANQIVKMVKNAYKKSQSSALSPFEKGIRLLFYGLSGTGKTELARYIAQELHKEISLYRASDIMDKYVGESEKAIRDAFAEAESSGNVLLFDEADSFFYDRTNVSKNWERSLVNEFLTQMEEFSGILICTTNLKQIMDPAMNRRFHILTEFKALTKDGINTLLNKFFANYDFTSEQTAKLCRYDSVTPGDFSTLYSKLRFCDDDFNSQQIIEELCKIQDEKGCNARKVGFM